MGLESLARRDEPLAPLTWFGLGGVAEYFAEPKSVDELTELIRRCHQDEIRVRLLGGGSNVLVRDAKIPGLVIRLRGDAFESTEVVEDRIVASGGTSLGHAVTFSVRAGLAGLEALVGIPGTVGGALHGNTGTRGGDVGQRTVRATVMTRDGEIHERTRSDMVFAYRQSSLNELVILSAEFQLEPVDPAVLTKRMQKQWIVKKSQQPMSHQSAGCIFKNPRGMHASALIEQAGLKGRRVGGAEVSPQHANFVIAHEGATPDDILKLVEQMRTTVDERMGVQLEQEIEVW